MRTTDFSKNITYYLTQYLPQEKGVSNNTILSYKETFIQLLLFMKEFKKYNINNIRIKHLSKDLILEFLDYVQNVRSCGNATRNLRLAAIHSFIQFLKIQNVECLYDLQEILTIPKKKSAQNSIKYISEDSVAAILRAPNLKISKGLRDVALLSLMYDSAARVQEIIDLTPSAVNLNKPQTVKLFGKGRKARIVPLLEGQTVHLSKYIKTFHLDAPENRLHPLFFNSRKERLTRAGINYILQKYVKMVKDENSSLIKFKVSCHTLRHSKAMHLLKAGVNIIYIRDILGHSSIQTTEIYARADSKQKRLAIEKAYKKRDVNEEPKWINNDNLLMWLKSF